MRAVESRRALVESMDREIEDRQFGVVNVQQGLDQGSSGLEAGRKK